MKDPIKSMFKGQPVKVSIPEPKASQMNQGARRSAAGSNAAAKFVKQAKAGRNK